MSRKPQLSDDNLSKLKLSLVIALESSTDFCTCYKLCSNLGISYSSLKMVIHSLRTVDGFAIISRSGGHGGGYKLARTRVELNMYRAWIHNEIYQKNIMSITVIDNFYNRYPELLDNEHAKGIESMRHVAELMRIHG